VAEGQYLLSHPSERCREARHVAILEASGGLGDEQIGKDYREGMARWLLYRDKEECSLAEMNVNVPLSMEGERVDG